MVLIRKKNKTVLYCNNLMSSRRKIRLVAVACLIYTGAATAQPPTAPAVPVITADVIRDEIQAKLQFSGTLISRRDAVLSAETDGRVVDLALIGTRFAKGGIISRLDDTLLQQILAENQAAAQSQHARIKFLTNEVKRLAKLAENNNAAISLLEQTQSDLDIARSELAAAQARTAQTEEKIRRMRLSAPFDGVVSTLHTEIGEWVSAGDALVELVDTESLEIETHVSADVLPYISIGDSIEVEIAGRLHKTELHTIVPVGDKTSRLFELRLAPDNTFGQPGLPARVLVPATAPRNSLLIPEDALVIRHDSISVFRIEEDMTATRIPVKPGLSTNTGLIEVSGALKAGDKVVTRGGERLRHGLLVRFAPPVNGKNENSSSDPR